MALFTWVATFAGVALAVQLGDYATPSGLQEASVAPDEEACKDKVLIIDVGGGSAKAWCFEKDGNPVQMPGTTRPIIVWTAKNGAGGTNPGLDHEMLADGQQTIQNDHGQPSDTVVLLPGAAANPGTECRSTQLNNIQSFHACSWGDRSTFLGAKRWNAMNDIHGAMLGGVQFTKLHLQRRSVPLPSELNVITFAFGTSPNGGYTVANQNGVTMNGRMSWMYGRNTASIKTAPKKSQTLSEDQEYYDIDMAYNFAVEESDDSVLSTDEQSFSQPVEAVAALMDRQWPFRNCLPFTFLLRDKNVKNLITESDKQNGKQFLSRTSDKASTWRQRLTQAIYSWTGAFKKENPSSCSSDISSRHIVLMGGNSLPLGGLLHEYIARGSQESPPVWVHVIDNSVLADRPPDLGSVQMSSLADPIMNFGIPDCKFIVHIPPVDYFDSQGKATADGREWGIHQQAGGVVLPTLTMTDEDPQQQWFPWRKSGYWTEDTQITFKYKDPAEHVEVEEADRDPSNSPIGHDEYADCVEGDCEASVD
jgi:hypothetical protein